jgi:nucleoside-diphosphate-sugar epimerase
MKTFSILGCGWLGFELAKSLKNDFLVKVSSRSEDKIELYKNEGLIPFLLNENNVDFLDDLLDTNYLFINFPPSKFDDYISFLEKIFLNKNLSKIEKIIFISSTSIYPNIDGIFDENSQLDILNSSLVYKAEKIFKSKIDMIFRVSGLVGGNRYFGKRSAGKIVEFPNTPINFVHRDDVIAVTKFVLDNNLKGIYNISSNKHPNKKEIYSYNSKKFGFDMPIFKNDDTFINRIIDGSKIERDGFVYKYNDVFSF